MLRLEIIWVIKVNVDLGITYTHEIGQRRKNRLLQLHEGKQILHDSSFYHGLIGSFRY